MYAMQKFPCLVQFLLLLICRISETLDEYSRSRSCTSEMVRERITVGTDRRIRN